MDASVEAWLDQREAHITGIVRRYGWYIEYVGGDTCSRPGCPCPPGDGPPFAYTVGLFGMNHPELLLFGVSPESAVTVLNALGERVRSGESLLPGIEVEIEGWDRRVIPEVVPNPGDIVFSANAFYRRPDEVSVPVLQLSYTDEGGRFPWAEGHTGMEKQPRPGTFRA
jgi:hypothetical protein